MSRFKVVKRRREKKESNCCSLIDCGWQNIFIPGPRKPPLFLYQEFLPFGKVLPDFCFINTVYRLRAVAERAFSDLLAV